METKKNCTLLPKELGEKVIKINLTTDKGEISRELLFVTKGGFIKEHSHAGEKQPSESYFDLIDYAENGAENMQHKPEVAGVNSPTGLLQHGIEQSNQPRVILAIKKDQSSKAWEGFDNLDEFLENCNVRFTFDKKSGEFFFMSRGLNEFTGERIVNSVKIDFTKNSVMRLEEIETAVWNNIHEETSLAELEASSGKTQKKLKSLNIKTKPNLEMGK